MTRDMVVCVFVDVAFKGLDGRATSRHLVCFIDSIICIGGVRGEGFASSKEGRSESGVRCSLFCAKQIIGLKSERRQMGRMLLFGITRKHKKSIFYII